MRSALVIFFALVFFIPVSAAGAEPESVLLNHEDVGGIWFPMAKADKLLADVRKLPLLGVKIGTLELKIQRHEEYALLLHRDIEATEQISGKWKTAFDEQLKVTEAQEVYYKDEIKSLRKWYRTPVLWFGVGVLLTGIFAVGLNYGLSETR